MGGEVALVTGASSGIGATTARRLAALGFTVYAAARRAERLEPLATDGIRVLAMDVTDDESRRLGIETILAETGRIDVLVNNAGYGSYGAVEDVSADEARAQFDVNLFGAAELIRLVLPAMRSQGSGTIVNISSMGGRLYTPFGGWYHATKYALEALSDCLRMEVAPFGVNVVIIEPGAIRTEWGAIAADRLLASSVGGAYEGRVERTADNLAAGSRTGTLTGLAAIRRRRSGGQGGHRPPSADPLPGRCRRQAAALPARSTAGPGLRPGDPAGDRLVVLSSAHSVQRALQVRPQILDVLDPDRQPQQSLGHDGQLARPAPAALQARLDPTRDSWRAPRAVRRRRRHRRSPHRPARSRSSRRIRPWCARRPRGPDPQAARDTAPDGPSGAR